MMTHKQVVDALQACKGVGDWQAIAQAAGVHYETVARIARGYVKDPKASIVERLAEAIDRRFTKQAA